MAENYKQLNASRIVETIGALQRRIADRFPESGLSGVGAELHGLAARSETSIRRLGRPIWLLRGTAWLAIGLLLLVIGLVVREALKLSTRVDTLPDLLQGTDAFLNVLIFLSLSIYFLFSLEERFKRRTALKSLHRLRTIVHIVDMHQLTKDPEFLLSPGRDTSSSPRRILSRFELARYLDYCSELLSLTSKVAALHLQELNDPVILDAVNDIETLAAALSNKIWQKIMILDTVERGAATPAT